MRKTLLIAASALAASIISSQAGVYSQNVVGYANLPAPLVGHHYLISCPFTVGVSNGVNEVFGSTLPAGTSLLLWNGTGFDTALYDNTDPAGFGTAVVWYQGDDTTPLSTLPTVPPGRGFFIAPTAPLTNVFAGAVAVNVGTSNKLSLPSPGVHYLVASAVPYAGAVTNGNTSTGGPDLNGLPAGSSLLIWNGTGYNTVVYDNTDPVGLGTAVAWYQGDDSTPYVDPSSGGNVPTIIVGQGFFIAPTAPYTWVTGL